MQKLKLTRVTAVVIGVVISLVVLAGGLLTYFSVFSRASNDAPQDVNITRVTSQSAVITWVTDAETQGTIEYGTTPAELGFYAPEALQGSTHRVELTLLQPNTTHYFIIRIGDNVFDNAGVPWSFSTTEVEDAEDEEATPEAILEEDVTPSPEESEEEPEEEETIPTIRSSSPTLTPKQAVPTIRSSTPTKTPAPTKISCTTTNCDAIAGYLGPGKCSVQDYYKCIYKQITPSVTPLLSVTPSSSPTPAIATPSNFGITVDSSTQATLTWSDNSNNENGFEVLRALFSSNPSFVAIATKSAGTTTHVDTTLISGTTYIYKIRAFIVGGSYSGTSNTYQITTP